MKIGKLHACADDVFKRFSIDQFKRLRRHGVEVVDAPPEDIAPALADAYLALKAAGRL